MRAGERARAAPSGRGAAASPLQAGRPALWGATSERTVRPGRSAVLPAPACGVYESTHTNSSGQRGCGRVLSRWVPLHRTARWPDLTAQGARQDGHLTHWGPWAGHSQTYPGSAARDKSWTARNQTQRSAFSSPLAEPLAQRSLTKELKYLKIQAL